MPKDKKLHLIAGMVIFLLSLLFVSPTMALGLAYAAGIGKELLDKYVISGTPELMDIVATVALPTVIYIIIRIRNRY